MHAESVKSTFSIDAELDQRLAKVMRERGLRYRQHVFTEALEMWLGEDSAGHDHPRRLSWAQNPRRDAFLRKAHDDLDRVMSAGAKIRTTFRGVLDAFVAIVDSDSAQDDVLLSRQDHPEGSLGARKPSPRNQGPAATFERTDGEVAKPDSRRREDRREHSGGRAETDKVRTGA